MLGLPLLFELCYSHGVIVGLKDWLSNVLLASFYYLFQLRTKAYGIQSGFHGSTAQYSATGRGFGLNNQSILSMYQCYARSHYQHALQLLLLLLLYLIFFTDEPFLTILLKTYAIIMAILSWIYAPCIFNPDLSRRSHDLGVSNLLKHIKETQVYCMWKWLHTDFQTFTSNNNANKNQYNVENSSWLNWWWREKYSMLQLRMMRMSMYKQSHMRTCMHHAATTSVIQVSSTHTQHTQTVLDAGCLLYMLSVCVVVMLSCIGVVSMVDIMCIYFITIHFHTAYVWNIYVNINDDSLYTSKDHTDIYLGHHYSLIFFLHPLLQCHR